MTLDEAFSLVHENGLTWHGLYQERGEWYVRLKTTATYSGLPSYGFGQHVELPTAIRQAILAAKEWERWRPSTKALPEAKAPALGDITDEQIAAAIALIKGKETTK